MVKRKSYAAAASRMRKRRAFGKRTIPRSMKGLMRTAGVWGRFRGGPGSENKYFDTVGSSAIAAVAAVPTTIGQLNLIPQGTSESERVGRACVLKSVQLKGTVYMEAGVSGVAETIAYIYLVQDTQCNGAAAAVTDVFTGTDITQALVNMDNSQRFRILKKIAIPLQSQAGVTAAYNNVTKKFDMYKKVNIPLDFSDTNGSISTIRSNNLFLISGTSTANYSACTLNAACRVRFSDH